MSGAELTAAQPISVVDHHWQSIRIDIVVDPLNGLPSALTYMFYCRYARISL